MKPLARLQVVRLNLFEKNCDEISTRESGLEEDDNRYEDEDNDDNESK